MRYYLTPNITANLQVSQLTLNKALVIKINLIKARFDVYIALEDLHQFIGTKRLAQANLTNLRHFLKTALKLLLIKAGISDKISIVNVAMANNVAVINKFEVSDKLTFDGFNVYTQRAGTEAISVYLQRLHNKFMLAHSLIFNSKMKFPISLGEAALTKEDVLQLKEGVIILLDEFHVKNNVLNCKINRIQVDLNLKNQAVNCN